MSWILWGRSTEQPPAPKPRDPRKIRKKDSALWTENSDTAPDLDAGDENGDEGDYELEWDSWPMDLARQARSSTDKHVTVTVPERSEPSSSTHGSHLHDRFRIGRSTSNMSLGPVSPAVRHEILSSANMGLLSVDSPALLTAPSVLPLQSSGVTTSIVSAGGVVRAQSLMSTHGGRRRGVARAMEIPADDLAKSSSSRKGKQKQTHEEHSLNASATSSMASMRSSGFSPTSTVRSTVSVLEVQDDTASMPVTGTTSTTTTTISVGSRRSSGSAETPRPGTSDKGGKPKGLRSGLAYSAERLVSKIESGWIS